MLVQAILVGIWAGIAGVDKLVLQTQYSSSDCYRADCWFNIGRC